MTNYIGQLIKRKREEQGLKRSEVASMVGYSNISKGCRKIIELERDGIIRPDFLKTLVKALEISKEEFEMAFQKDKADFENWLNVPVPMKMIVRYMPAFYVSHEIPDHIVTAEEAAQYIMDFTSNRRNLKACLVLSRRWSFWAENGGGTWKETTYENQINRPRMFIGGRAIQFTADAVCDWISWGCHLWKIKRTGYPLLVGFWRS